MQTPDPEENRPAVSSPWPESVTDSAVPRPRTAGKFLAVGDAKLWVRGVTYGPFRPDARGSEYPTPDVLVRDFALMTARGLNAIRTYTVPPPELLDAAAAHGLRALVGIPWEQHVTFLDEQTRPWTIVERIRAGVRACARHPAVLGYAIGNEIPSPIVRWHGRRRTEAFLRRLYEAAKSADPDGLVTYVNYPTTEYLELPFLDFVTFNVYLESEIRLAAYLPRLQNIAGDRPLMLSEIGIDSRRHGKAAQARVLDWQVRTAFGAGCAGTFVFAWTDEWHRGGYEIEDWDFGVVDRQRRPKPALAAVQGALEDLPLPKEHPWPRISVVVCTYNGSRTITDCLEGLLRLEYPNFEVVVVDDGSTDDTAAIVSAYGFRLIRTPNRGLSSARNTGMAAATGEIVAYIDDDAYPDPHWLTYLAHAFTTTEHAAVGGPNIPPPDDGPIATCVAHAPGGPAHVLLSDTVAEHIPGCNMAFRRECLEAIGGFDVQFRTAGDDVDVCWRLQQRGWTLGFHAAAMVWHHRRNSVKAYWRQQRGYGRAEALLERKWPEKYNRAGHPAWAGRVYGRGLAKPANWFGGRIYQGSWGSAPFQSLYQPVPNPMAAVIAMPEWYLVIGALAVLTSLGTLWSRLLAVLPLLGLAVGVSLVRAWVSAAEVTHGRPGPARERLALHGLTALLHLLQPLARLRGWLSLEKRPSPGRPRVWILIFRPLVFTAWSERWLAPAEWVRSVQSALQAMGVPVVAGGDFDRWDLEIRGGRLGGVRALMVVEEHGAGRQFARLRAWPSCTGVAVAAEAGLVILALLAVLDGAATAAGILAGTALLIAVQAAVDVAIAGGAVAAAWLAREAVGDRRGLASSIRAVRRPGQ
jgi:glycosyltransferase involved in cell wall biosynthesis